MTDGGLGARLRSVRELDDALEVVVDVGNDGDRTLHYIAEVRAIDYDPDTRRLRLRLSDRGRQLLIEAAMVEPTFRTVEPGGEASLVLSLPRTIVRLAPQAEPSPEPRFEEQRIADATEVEVEIGWSRTPYYADVRGRAEPPAAWEEGSARAALTVRRELTRRRRPSLVTCRALWPGPQGRRKAAHARWFPILRGCAIAYNGGDGVAMEGTAAGNTVVSNLIFVNGTSDDDVGIDLGLDGVTANDGDDVDSGPNDLLNHPLITAVDATAGTVGWTLDGLENTNYRLEFYASLFCDGSGSGEGQRYLGAVNVNTNSKGWVRGTTATATPPAAGDHVTMTTTRRTFTGLFPVTSDLHETSEFSPCRAV